MAKLRPPKIFYCQHPLFAPEKNSLLEIKLLFEKAVEESNSMTLQPGNDIVLKLYSLYNQATKGDIDTKQPTSADNMTKAKYEAWASQKGKSAKDAQREYIMLVYKLKN